MRKMTSVLSPLQVSVAGAGMQLKDLVCNASMLKQFLTVDGGEAAASDLQTQLCDLPADTLQQAERLFLSQLDFTKLFTVRMTELHRRTVLELLGVLGGGGPGTFNKREKNASIPCSPPCILQLTLSNPQLFVCCFLDTPPAFPAHTRFHSLNSSFSAAQPSPLMFSLSYFLLDQLTLILVCGPTLCCLLSPGVFLVFHPLIG